MSVLMLNYWQRNHKVVRAVVILHAHTRGSLSPGVQVL
jgi:hypothetical protein